MTPFDAYRVAAPLLRALPPETAHRAALLALKAGLAGRAPAAADPILACRLWGLDFASPIGLAAGFDKDAEALAPLARLGFGFLEAGTVTPRPQPGNQRPRLYRLDADAAVINRLGFNNRGLEGFAKRLAAAKAAGLCVPVGANIGRNRDTEDEAADYEVAIGALAGIADYLVVNVSSPNTPGLRALQGRGPLQALVARCLDARERAARGGGKRPPLLVKVAPDLDEEGMAAVAEVAIASGIDGLVVGNTTAARPDTLRSPEAGAAGGLSGRPLYPLALECVRAFRRLTGGRLPLIGCGGVASGEDAYRMIRAGASLVQLYTALVFHGPMLAARIRDDLAARLAAAGYDSVAAAVGEGAEAGPARARPVRPILAAAS